MERVEVGIVNPGSDLMCPGPRPATSLSSHPRLSPTEAVSDLSSLWNLLTQPVPLQFVIKV